MKPLTKIYIAIAVAAIFAAGIIGVSLWSDRKIRVLEKAVEEAKQKADAVQQKASQMEQETAKYKEKTEYLERQIAGIQTIARKQDEQLETLTNNSRDARARVARARNVRSVATEPGELCKKLADAGHACQQ